MGRSTPRILIPQVLALGFLLGVLAPGGHAQQSARLTADAGFRAAPVAPPLEPAAPADGTDSYPGRVARRVELTPRQRRIWLALALAEHGAAFFDARTTRDAIGKGYRELNPMFAPFAHSAAIYPAMQISHLGLDWLALRMATSRHSWLRHLWWLPQTAATAGSLWAGAHNLGLLSRRGWRLR